MVARFHIQVQIRRGWLLLCVLGGLLLAVMALPAQAVLNDTGIDCRSKALSLTEPLLTGAYNFSSEVSIDVTSTIASGAALYLTAPLLTLAPGFSVASGGRLTATSAPVTCTAAVAQAQPTATARSSVPEPVEILAPAFFADTDALPSWLQEHLAALGLDPAALTGGLLDADERWLILETSQALHPADANDVTDLYRLDLLTDDLRLISVTESGQAGNGPSRDPAADAYGERVVFTSDAGDLAPDDDNGLSDLFLRDLARGHSQRLTHGDQTSAHPAVDAWGQSLVYDQTGPDGPRQILGQALMDGATAEVLSLSEAAHDAYRPALSNGSKTTRPWRFLLPLSPTPLPPGERG